MRQKRVVMVAIAIVTVFAAVLIGFACSRSAEEPAAAGGGQGHAERAAPPAERVHAPAAAPEAPQGPAVGAEAAPAEHAHVYHAEPAASPEPGGSEGAPALSGTLENGVRVVEVKARQFAFDPGQIVVQAGQPVRLKVTSQDVTHGIEIQAFGIDRRLDPNKTEVIEFTPDKPGSYHFECSIYCGAGHNDMNGELVVRQPGR